MRKTAFPECRSLFHGADHGDLGSSITQHDGSGCKGSENINDGYRPRRLRGSVQQTSNADFHSCIHTPRGVVSKHTHSPTNEKFPLNDEFGSPFIRRVNHKLNLQGIPLRRPDFRQTRLPLRAVSRFQINDLGILHGRLPNDERSGLLAGTQDQDIVETRHREPKIYGPTNIGLRASLFISSTKCSSGW
jgi:hypothetical protein